MELEDLDFADDFVLLSHQIKDIREKTNKLSEIGKKIWLNINSKKTKIVKVKTIVCPRFSIPGYFDKFLINVAEFFLVK